MRPSVLGGPSYFPSGLEQRCESAAQHRSTCLYTSTGIESEPGALPLLIQLMAFVTSSSSAGASSSAFWSVWRMRANASSFTLEE